MCKNGSYMKKISIVAISVALMTLSGCSTVKDYMPDVTDYIPNFLKPYTPDVHQGNIVTSEMIESLHEGMTRNQVLFLLGSPTLRSTFHQNEWDYVYYLEPRNGEVQLRRLTVKFDEDGRVGEFISDPMPNETNADLLILGERARESTVKKVQGNQDTLKDEAGSTTETDKQ